MSANHTAQVEQLGKKINLTQQVVSIGITIITTMVIVYGFFYNMSKTIEYHTGQIKDLQISIEKMRSNVQENEVYKGVSETEMKAVQDKINSIESKVDRMDEKLDKILMRK